MSVVYSRRGDDESASAWEGWRIGNLRPLYEPILWFSKPYRIGGTIADNVLEHGVGAYDESGFVKYTGAPNNIVTCGLAKGEGGMHPTQKPVKLMAMLIELTTQKDHLVLDSFAGSGSTLVAAKLLGRRYMGFELNSEYVDTCTTRLEPTVLFQ